MRTLMSVDPEVEILISPPFNQYAYALTKEVNEVTNLVRFLEPFSDDMQKDRIVVVANRNRTWEALSKRLSYDIHRQEGIVAKQLEFEKERLEGLVVNLDEVNKNLPVQIDKLSTNGIRQIEDTRDRLLDLGKNYTSLVEGLGEQMAVVADRLQRLEIMRRELSEQI